MFLTHGRVAPLAAPALTHRAGHWVAYARVGHDSALSKSFCKVIVDLPAGEHLRCRTCLAAGSVFHPSLARRDRGHELDRLHQALLIRLPFDLEVAGRRRRRGPGAFS
jgi:hypothetical protein